MKPVFILSLIILLAHITVGQVLEFNDLQKLPNTVNSKAEESMPLYSPTHNKLFFVRSLYSGNTGGRFAGLDIWFSDRKNSTWQMASNRMEPLNDKDNNVLIGISRDGKTFYTMNSSPTGKLEGFYFSKYHNNAWSKPEFVPIPGINNLDFVSLFVSPDYDVIFLSMQGDDSNGQEDIYVSVKDSRGRWSRPKNIGATINTEGFEIAPFLSADKKRLYFASNGHGGFGDADIFYSERLYNSWETWSAPVNLGNTINSKKFDAYFSVYGDTVAYFCSNREGELADIYSTQVEKRNVFLLSGEKYLTEEEWNSVVGKNVQHELTFSNRNTILTSAQKEYLYFLANRVSPREDIKIQIIVQEEENPEVSRSRLREIYGELRQAGVDSNHIREEHRPESVQASDKGVIKIMLFRSQAN